MASGLLARGREVLDELFPGLSEEAVSQGAIYGDIVDEVLWFNYGVYLRNTPSSLKGLLVSRPMLEELVRRRVLQLPNVRLHEQTEILEPICDRMEGRVTGVRSQSTAGTCTSEVIDCDLLVDASGRGSKSQPGSRRWLTPNHSKTVFVSISGCAKQLFVRMPVETEYLMAELDQLNSKWQPDVPAAND